MKYDSGPAPVNSVGRGHRGERRWQADSHMDGIEIVRFEAEDLAFGKMLTDLEGWHRTIADWNRLLRVEPSGMFKARVRGQDVGIAGVISYDGVSWIHSVIVLPECRRNGVGRTMMKVCVAEARKQGNPCVKLDAVRGFEDFYRKLGFVEEFASMRFIGDWQHFAATAERIQPSDLDGIQNFDKSVAGCDRGRVIRAIYEDYPSLAFHIRTEEGIVGYILGREGEERIQIGPCVVANGDLLTAQRLVTTLIGSCKNAKKFRMCVPGENLDAVRLAEGLGFVNATPSVRMHLGTPVRESTATFAMISPEKG
jgi:ribosomal protein S18 acetylase RimI-like enzyme